MTMQSATINTAFANALGVTVKDAGNNPVSGVNVTFTASGWGAAGVFSISAATTIVASTGSGVASAPFTANATAGGPYTVTAGAAGLTTVNFSLTNTAAEPILSTLSLTQGPVGASITITGSNFGSTPGSVTFNGTSATPTAWSPTSIDTTVPGGATTGNVVVTVGGMASNGLPFTVTPPPNIASISPTSGPVGTVVTINGTNFGPTVGTRVSGVTFNGVSARTNGWSDTQILVPVPAGEDSGNVVVSISGVASNAVLFTVTSAPAVTSVSPTGGPVGTSVTITGTSFGPIQGTSTVTFNGTAATPTSWSNTNIAAPVPTGATTGNVVVSIGRFATNDGAFTVTSGTCSIKLVQHLIKEPGITHP